MSALNSDWSTLRREGSVYSYTSTTLSVGQPHQVHNRILPLCHHPLWHRSTPRDGQGRWQSSSSLRSCYQSFLLESQPSSTQGPGCSEVQCNWNRPVGCLCRIAAGSRCPCRIPPRANRGKYLSEIFELEFLIKRSKTGVEVVDTGNRRLRNASNSFQPMYFAFQSSDKLILRQ